MALIGIFHTFYEEIKENTLFSWIISKTEFPNLNFKRKKKKTAACQWLFLICMKIILWILNKSKTKKNVLKEIFFAFLFIFTFFVFPSEINFKFNFSRNNENFWSVLFFPFIYNSELLFEYVLFDRSTFLHFVNS